MRVGERGQVTVPKELRDRFGLGAGTDVTFEVRDGMLTLRKQATSGRGVRVVDRLRGRGDIPLTTDETMAMTRGD